MENEDSNQGAIIHTDKQGPHGLRENVSSRGGGVTEGKEENHPFKPQDDLLTEVRRARYGETPAFIMHQGEPMQAVENDVNQVEAIVHLTRDDVIQGKYGSLSGFGRIMSQ
jgi:hypothetical protein